MIFDWDTVTLKTGTNSTSGSNDLDSFNLTSLLEGMSFDNASIKNIQIAYIPAFFHMQKPQTNNASLSDLIDGLGLKGTMTIDYTYTTGEEGSEETHDATVTILNDETVQFMGENVPWPSDSSTIIASDEMQQKLKAQETDEENPAVYDSAVIPFVTKVADGQSHDKYSFMTDLSEIINKYPDAIKFNYDLALSSDGGDAVIYHAWTDEAETSEEDVTSINVDMAILLSFNMELLGDISIDAMSFYDDEWETNTEKDLLNRDGASSYDDYKKYCDAIKKFGLTYTVKNNVFDGLDMAATLVDEVSAINKEISLNTNGVNSLAFSGTEIKTILTTYPFHPQSTILLKGGTETKPKNLVITRSAMDSENGAGLSASVSVVMECTDRHAVTVWGDEE